MYVYIYIYMCMHCIYYHYAIMIHHHTPTSCPFSLVARYAETPRSDSNSSPRWGLKILKPSDMSTSMGWMVLWVESYGLYPQGPRKDQWNSFDCFAYVLIPWVLSGVVAKENPSPFRDFLFGDEVRTLHLGWNVLVLPWTHVGQEGGSFKITVSEAVLISKTETHSTRGSWMMSV